MNNITVQHFVYTGGFFLTAQQFQDLKQKSEGKISSYQLQKTPLDLAKC